MIRLNEERSGRGREREGGREEGGREGGRERGIVRVEERGDEKIDGSDRIKYLVYFSSDLQFALRLSTYKISKKNKRGEEKRRDDNGYLEQFSNFQNAGQRRFEFNVFFLRMHGLLNVRQDLLQQHSIFGSLFHYE